MLFLSKANKNGIQQSTLSFSVFACSTAALQCVAMAPEKPRFIRDQSRLLRLGRACVHCYHADFNCCGLQLRTAFKQSEAKQPAAQMDRCLIDYREYAAAGLF
ncbi:hypothetical protein D3C78_1563630 [compost metagenome]